MRCARRWDTHPAQRISFLGSSKSAKPGFFKGPWENSLRAWTDSAFGTFSLSLLNHAVTSQQSWVKERFVYRGEKGSKRIFVI